MISIVINSYLLSLISWCYRIINRLSIMLIIFDHVLFSSLYINLVITVIVEWCIHNTIMYISRNPSCISQKNILHLSWFASILSSIEECSFLLYEFKHFFIVPESYFLWRLWLFSTLTAVVFIYYSTFIIAANDLTCSDIVTMLIDFCSIFRYVTSWF